VTACGERSRIRNRRRPLITQCKKTSGGASSESFVRRFVQISLRRSAQRPIFSGLCKKKFGWCFYVLSRLKKTASLILQRAKIRNKQNKSLDMDAQKTLILCGLLAPRFFSSI
jgi:hypothetical protein